MNRKEGMTPKIETNFPLYHGIQILKLKWLTLEFVKFS